MIKRLKQSAATAVRRCFHGFVSGTIGIGLNMAVWVAWVFDCLLDGRSVS